LIQGVREGVDPTVLYGDNTLTTFFYGLRLFAGLLLLSANLSWLCLLERVRRSAHESRRPVADGVVAPAVVESPIGLPDYGVPLNKVSEV